MYQCISNLYISNSSFITALNGLNFPDTLFLAPDPKLIVVNLNSFHSTPWSNLKLGWTKLETRLTIRDAARLWICIWWTCYSSVVLLINQRCFPWLSSGKQDPVQLQQPLQTLTNPTSMYTRICLYTTYLFRAVRIEYKVLSWKLIFPIIADFQSYGEHE